MKIRSLLFVAAGICVGYALAKKTSQDVPYVVKGPRDEQISGNPALRAITGGAQRLADQATVKSLDAIRRARGAIQNRLSDDETDDAVWN